MNISSYTQCEEDNRIYSGRLSLMKDFHIVNADETVYRYLGVNAGRPISALIHEEDYPCFEDAIKHLSEGNQHIIARFLGHDGQYHCMYMIISYNGRVVDNFKEIDIDIQDIVAFHEKYDRIHASVFKYRKFMTYSPNMYMEYYYDTEVINFFEYSNERSVTHFKENIDVADKMISDSDKFTDKQKIEFKSLYDFLKNKIDNIEVSVDGAVFGINNYYLKIRGGIIYSGEEKYLLAAVVSKTSYSQLETEEKYYMSSYALDPATDAYNKRAIVELANDMLYKSTKTHYLCMMDVDDFKLINDTYGHLIGDKVVAQVASTIQRILAARGYVGRFGGDEFLIITDKIKDSDDLINLLKTVRKNVLYSCKELVPSLDVTFSIGIAEYPTHGVNYETLFRVADKCLYIAKAKGKNRYIKYNPELHGEIDAEDSSQDNDVQVNIAKRYTDTYKFLSDINRYKTDGLKEVLDNVRNTFDIDGISIFDNASFERKYTSGRYVDSYDKLDFIDRIANMIDSSGVIAVNKVMQFEEHYPDVYEKMAKQNTSGVLIVKGKKSTVVYDIFARNRKWSENDKGMLMMIGRTLDDIL